MLGRVLESLAGRAREMKQSRRRPEVSPQKIVDTVVGKSIWVLKDVKASLESFRNLDDDNQGRFSRIYIYNRALAAQAIGELGKYVAEFKPEVVVEKLGIDSAEIGFSIPDDIAKSLRTGELPKDFIAFMHDVSGSQKAAFALSKTQQAFESMSSAMKKKVKDSNLRSSVTMEEILTDVFPDEVTSISQHKEQTVSASKGSRREGTWY
jgi:hypothetical protein